MYNGVDCRETLKLEPNRKNKLYAAHLRAEILRKITLGSFKYVEYFPNSKKVTNTQNEVPTFKKAAELWLSIKETELALSSYITYQKYLEKYWIPFFGERKIDLILTSEISACLAKIQTSNKTKNNILIPVRSILDSAFYDGLINQNPADRIKNLKWQKREPDPFTLEEIDLILASMREDFHPSVANYFEFAFFSGLRPSELIEVKWNDVNNLSITVRRAKVENQVKDTKTYKVRDVLLNQRALDSLRRQSAYKHISSEYIFFNPETLSQWNCDKAQNITFWIPTLQKLEIRHRVPYQTRHTFATILLVKGINPMWVSKQMGHVNMKMLLEVYAKWIDLGDKSKEIDRVNNALFSTNFVQP